jgi:hypothetical protein
MLIVPDFWKLKSQNLQFEIFEKFKELIFLIYERISKLVVWDRFLTYFVHNSKTPIKDQY